MTVLTIYKGRKGLNGSNGVNGLGPSDINTFDMEDPISSLLNPNNHSNNAVINYTRTGYGAFTDRYGNEAYARNQETTNYITWASNFSNWSDLSGRWSYIGTTTDPFGGNNASEINLDVDTDSLTGNGEVAEIIVNNVPTGRMVTVSFYVKVISGSVSGLDFVTGSNKYTVRPATSDWVRVVYPIWPSSSFIFSINPRGLTGARIGVYGVQIENSNTATDLIETTGTQITRVFNGDRSKQSDKGYLIEEAKTNLVKNSNNLSTWTLENCTVGNYDGLDPFRHDYQLIRVNWASIAQISLTGDTDSLTAAQEYNVSFYAYITGGSVDGFAVSLGNGVEVSLDNPSVEGFQRVSVKCIAGNDDNIKISATSTALNAQLLISCVQVEAGDLTSYIDTGNQTSSRAQDLFQLNYSYNIPKPSDNWTFVFRCVDKLNNPTKKTIFSNGESGANEFSVYYEGNLLNINNGSNVVNLDVFSYEKVALVYDGVNIKFFGETELLSTQSLSSTDFIASNFYLGSNGTDEFLNAYLSYFSFYTSALTYNEILYLMGK